jgi:hypothetical protein
LGENGDENDDSEWAKIRFGRFAGFMRQMSGKFPLDMEQMEWCRMDFPSVWNKWNGTYSITIPIQLQLVNS